MATGQAGMGMRPIHEFVCLSHEGINDYSISRPKGVAYFACYKHCAWYCMSNIKFYGRASN